MLPSTYHQTAAATSFVILLIDKFIVLIVLLHRGVETLIIRLRFLSLDAQLVDIMALLVNSSCFNVVRIVVKRGSRCLK